MIHKLQHCKGLPPRSIAEEISTPQQRPEFAALRTTHGIIDPRPPTP